MAKNKKNKKEQTFNVYPFLAEYGIGSSYLPKAQQGDSPNYTFSLDTTNNPALINYMRVTDKIRRNPLIKFDEDGNMVDLPFDSVSFDDVKDKLPFNQIRQQVGGEFDYIPQTQRGRNSDEYNRAMQFRQDNPNTFGSNYAFSNIPSYYQGPADGFGRIIIDDDLRNLINRQQNAGDFTSMLSGMKPNRPMFVDYRTDFSMPGSYTYEMPGMSALGPAYQGNLNQAQIEQLMALSNQINAPKVYPNLSFVNQVFSDKDLRVDEDSLGTTTDLQLIEIPEVQEEDLPLTRTTNINDFVDLDETDTREIDDITNTRIDDNKDRLVDQTDSPPLGEPAEDKLTRKEKRQLRRAQMFQDAYIPQTMRQAQDGEETEDDEKKEEEKLSPFELQRKRDEDLRKQRNEQLGISRFSNTNLGNLFAFGQGIGRFAKDVKYGFPNATKKGSGEPYDEYSFKNIKVENPTGENAILNTKLLDEYIRNPKGFDRDSVKQEDLWMDPDKVRMDAFNQGMQLKSELFPEMFSNQTMDLDGNITYDDVTVPNPNYDKEKYEATGDPAFGPTITQPFDLEIHGTEFDKAENNLKDYNAVAFISDDKGFFDPDNITFSRFKDGQKDTESYDPEKNYRDQTVTTSVQEDINKQFDNEDQERFGGTIRFQNGGSALRTFLRKAATGTPVDQDAMKMGPFQQFDQDGDGVPDAVEPPGADNPLTPPLPQPAPFIGPVNQQQSDVVPSEDAVEDQEDLGVTISYGDTLPQQLANRAEEFVMTSGVANFADSFVRNIGEPTMDLIRGFRSSFDAQEKENLAREKGDEAMDIVSTIEASRAAKGDREFRTGVMRPSSQTQEEIYGQLAMFGGQPSTQTGPDYSMIMSYMPSQSLPRYSEEFLLRQMKDGGNIVDVDMDTLKELMAAGADIEIL